MLKRRNSYIYEFKNNETHVLNVRQIQLVSKIR